MSLEKRMTPIDVWSVTYPLARRTQQTPTTANQSHMNINGCSTLGRVRHLHLSLIVTNERAAVVLNDGRQLRRRELAIGHPARELVVPDAVVTTEELAIRLCEVCDLVAAGESEGTFRGFGSILTTSPLAMQTICGTEKAHCYPFHAVPRGDLSEHRSIIQDRRICGIRELGVVRC